MIKCTINAFIDKLIIEENNLADCKKLLISVKLAYNNSIKSILTKK